MLAIVSAKYLLQNVSPIVCGEMSPGDQCPDWKFPPLLPSFLKTGHSSLRPGVLLEDSPFPLLQVCVTVSLDSVKAENLFVDSKHDYHL